MSYITAHHDKYNDKIVVWEKKDGKRVVKQYDCPYYFYVPDANGDFLSLTGEALRKVILKDKTSFDEACSSYKSRFESDLTPLEKLMMDTYCGVDVPELTVGLVDIEVDYDPAVGFPRPHNPYAPINALTLYNTSQKSFVSLLVPPPGWKEELPQEMQDDNYIICSDERMLLDMFFELIVDCDVLSGWNSEFFDMPYIGKRVEMLYGAHGLKKLGFEKAPSPYWSAKERFKGSNEKEIVLAMNSRVHLDYLLLFRKFNLEGRQSFSLASIADDELDLPKMTYEGTLYELYRGSFRPNLKKLLPETEWDDLYRAQVDREFLYQEIEQGHISTDIVEAYQELDRQCRNLSFIKFSQYNRRDVEVLRDIDKKFKYIELASRMVHEATVNFNAIFGSVQLIDSAIINYCHTVFKRIVFDRKHKAGEEVEGALVLTPNIGLHRMIGAVDINSLYPNTYRTLNLSPEKIVGQLLEYEQGWNAVYKAVSAPEGDVSLIKNVTLLLEGSSYDEAIQMTAGDLISLLKEKKFAISAYGTILDQGNGEGLLPSVLSYWFKGRKELQAKKKEFAKKAEQRLKDVNGDKTDSEYQLLIKESEYYDMLQGVRKVLLNSAYGATLNEFCRFHDPRLGASTTGSGRQITTHMIHTIAKGLIGENHPRIVKTSTFNSKKQKNENDYTIKCPDDIGPIYSDTDSCYFTMANIVSNPEEAVECADAIAQMVNDSFPDFVQTAFLCQPEFSDRIKVAREIVATAGIFRAKKKYVMHVYDLEGTRLDPTSPKSLKTQGSDIKISSTPEMIRKLLKDVTMMILTGEDKLKIQDYVINFRRNLLAIESNASLNILDFASVNSIKTLDEYYMKWERIEKPGLGKVKGLPSHVRAAINHNEFIKAIGETNTQPIMNGQKCKVLWLEPNEFEFKNIAFTSETEVLPEWFNKYFKVNLKETESKFVDHKLELIFEPIGWQVPTEHTVKVNKLLSFDD